MDPNKYAKNAKIKTDNPLDTLKSAVALILMILGLVGIGVGLFKKNSPIILAFAWVFEKNSHIVVIPLALGAFWLFDKMTSSPSPSENKKAGNLPMYIMMALGAYYLYKLVTTGEF